MWLRRTQSWKTWFQNFSIEISRYSERSLTSGRYLGFSSTCPVTLFYCRQGPWYGATLRLMRFV